MLVESSHLKDQIEKKMVTPQGNFYFFEDYIISEFNEGTLVNYQTILPLIEEAKLYYGEDMNIAYISNRVHSYSVNPVDWIRFYKEHNTIVSTAVVAYTNLGLSNVLLESLFVKGKIKRFNSLLMAKSWADQTLYNFRNSIPVDLRNIA